MTSDRQSVFGPRRAPVWRAFGMLSSCLRPFWRRGPILSALRQTKFFRRRRFIVNKPLQLSLVASALVYALLVVLTVALSLFLPLFSDLETHQGSSFEAWETATNILFLHEKLWPPILFTLLAVCLHAVWISHKIAGPLYRFKQLFRSIASGVIPRTTRLRHGDLLHPEMEEINVMMAGLRERMEGLKSAQQELERALASSQQLLAGSPCPATATAMHELEQKVRSLHEQLEHLRLP
ncbi:MAG: hypothetical protein AB1486_26670 [Planctomycetota bacterium]